MCSSSWRSVKPESLRLCDSRSRRPLLPVLLLLPSPVLWVPLPALSGPRLPLPVASPAAGFHPLPAFPTGASPAPSAAGASPAAGLPSASAESGRPGVSEQERREIARGICAFFKSCLAGGYRGTSGRDRNPLASRCYVVVADFSGMCSDPPLLFDQFAPVKELCKRASATGSSIFCGFPAQWDAKLACEAAGLSLPKRPDHVGQQ